MTPFVQGSIEHNQSGLTLTKGATEVELSNFRVDPGESMLFGKVLVNAKPFPESGEEVPLFFLDGSTLNPLRDRGRQGHPAGHHGQPHQDRCRRAEHGV